MMRVCCRADSLTPEEDDYTGVPDSERCSDCPGWKYPNGQLMFTDDGAMFDENGNRSASDEGAE